MISHRQRLENCLSGKAVDRPPVALWRHFPVDDQTPEGLAYAALVFQRTFDFDLVKVTPSSSYCLKDWGAEDEWHGATEGTRDYTRRVIQHPEDWERLTVLKPDQGYLGAELHCLRLLVDELGSATPIIQTIFNPLSQAKNLVGGENLLVHMRHYPAALHAGLKVITESTILFIEALKKTGIYGIFYAVQHAQYSLLSLAEYNTFGRTYDLEVLEPAQEMWLRMLHLHGPDKGHPADIMFDLFMDYPVNILNWHDRETSLSLSLGQARFPGAVCGGVNRESLVYETPERVKEETLDAIQATGGPRAGGMILGTGCVTPIIAPYGNILAVRQSVE
jgi:uroporphyrinogen decarboxylase